LAREATKKGERKAEEAADALVNAGAKEISSKVGSQVFKKAPVEKTTDEFEPEFVVEREETKEEPSFLTDLKGGSIESAEKRLRSGEVSSEEKNEVLRQVLNGSLPVNPEKVAALLLEYGANPDVRNDKGRTLWSLTCEHGSFDDLKFLAKKWPQGINIPDNDGKTPLMILCSGHCYSYEDVVAFLLANGARVDLQDKKKQTSLHYICNNNDSNVVCNGLSLTVARLLIDKWPEAINIPNDTGETPLHIACSNGGYDVIKLFLDHGANVRVLDDKGQAPLHRICNHETTLQESKSEVALKIFEKWPEAINCRDKQGVTPFELALVSINWRYSVCLETIKTFIKHGANFSLMVGENGQNPLHVLCECGREEAVEFALELFDLLIKNSPNLINKRNKEGYTPLLYLCSQVPPIDGRFFFERLLKNGADLEATTPYTTKAGWKHTALHRACQSCWFDYVQGLVNRRANIEAKDNTDWTPAHMVAYTGKLANLQFLLSKGACIDVRDTDGKTPRDLAKEQGHDDVAALLAEAEYWDNLKNGRGVFKVQDVKQHLEIMAGNPKVFSALLVRPGMAEYLLEITAKSDAQRLLLQKIAGCCAYTETHDKKDTVCLAPLRALGRTQNNLFALLNLKGERGADVSIGFSGDSNQPKYPKKSIKKPWARSKTQENRSSYDDETFVDSLGGLVSVGKHETVYKEGCNVEKKQA